jgi:hypothetical protein
MSSKMLKANTVRWWVPECTGTSFTLWTGDLHYNPLVLQRPWIRSHLVFHLEICQQSRLWGCGNPVGISKECGKGGKPVSWLSMLSILCHFHGLLWKRASQNQNPAKTFLNAGTARPNRLDERIGDDALIEAFQCQVFALATQPESSSLRFSSPRKERVLE